MVALLMGRTISDKMYWALCASQKIKDEASPLSGHRVFYQV